MKRQMYNYLLSKNIIDQKFVIDELDSFDTASSTLLYFLKTTKFLTCGGTRAVFDLEDGTVAKVSIRGSRASNKQEIAYSKMAPGLVPTVHKYDSRNYNWLIMDKVIALNKNNVKSYLGVPYIVLNAIIYMTLYRAIEDDSKRQLWHTARQLTPVFRLDQMAQCVDKFTKNNPVLKCFFEMLSEFASKISDDNKIFIALDLCHRTTNLGLDPKSNKIVILDIGQDCESTPKSTFATKGKNAALRMSKYNIRTDDIIEARAKRTTSKR